MQTDRIKNLIRYFTECIEIESLEDFSFPSFLLDQNFINVPTNTEWSHADISELTINPPPKFRRSLALGGGTASIYYGWPVFCKPQKTKDGRPYAWIEPAFLLKVGFEQNGTQYDLALEKEWPRLNNRILGKVTDTLEERIQVIDSLGLSDAEEIPGNGLIDYWNALKELYPELEEIEPTSSDQVNNSDFSDIASIGFYNRSILMVANAPRYSRQLLRELRIMQETNHLQEIPNTSLGCLISVENHTNDEEFKLSQITRLNRSQRKSVTSAFKNRLSVITGPPGTGKSQVVLNVLSNAFEKQQDNSIYQQE